MARYGRAARTTPVIIRHGFDLPPEIDYLQAAFAGVSTVAAGPRLNPLSVKASVGGTSSASANLKVTRGLAATVTGTSSVSANLKVTRRLQASVAGVASVSVNAIVTKTLQAAVAGVGSASAVPRLVPLRLQASTAGAGAATCNLKVTRRLQATVTSVSTVTAQPKLIPLSVKVAAVAGTSQVTARMGTAYENRILSLGPIMYLRVNEPSGTTAEDSTTNNNDGTYVNTPTLGETGALAGDSNKAVRLVAASNHYISVADAASLDVGDAFSLELWVKFATVASGGAFMTKTAAGGWFFGLVAGNIRLDKVGGTAPTGSAINAPVSLSNGVWYHIVVVKNGATAAVAYLNGVDVSAGVDTSVAFENNAQTIGIGRRVDTGGSKLDATVDEPTIYAFALSAAQVQENYRIGAGTGLEADSAGAGAVTARLTLSPNRLQASFVGSSVTTANLSVSKFLTASVVGVGAAVVPTLRLSPLRIQGTTAGTSSVSGNAKVTRGLRATVTALGTVNAATPKLVPLRVGASTSGVAAITCNLVTSTPLAASVAGAATVTAAPRLQTAVRATSAGAGTLSANLTVTAPGGSRPLAAQITGTSAVSAYLAGQFGTDKEMPNRYQEWGQSVREDSGKTHTAVVVSSGGGQGNVDLVTDGYNTLTLMARLTGGADADLAVTVRPYEDDGTTLFDMALTATEVSGPTHAGGIVRSMGTYNVRGLAKVQVRVVNNNASQQTANVIYGLRSG